MTGRNVSGRMEDWRGTTAVQTPGTLSCGAFVTADSAVGLPAWVIRRDPAGGTVEVTGYLRMNAEGSDMWDGIAVERGLDPETAAARFAVNEANRTVAAFPVASGEKGGTRVARSDGRQAHVMHLCNVFDDHRSLRPDGKRDVILSRRVGPDGKPYLLIDLQTAQPKPTGTREGSKEHERRAQAKARREQRQKGSAGTQG